MNRNIQKAREITSDLTRASNILVSSIGPGTKLSGAAFKKGQDLFSVGVIPTIKRAQQAVERLNVDLSNYRGADGIVSSEGILDEDKLKQQIESKKNLKRSYENVADDLRGYAQAIDYLKIPFLGMVLRDMASNYNHVADSYQEQIQKLEDKLEMLHQFNSKVSRLFRDAAEQMKIVVQAVMVLNSSSMSASGQPIYPAGVGSDWFTKKQSAKNQEKLAAIQMSSALGITVDEALELYGKVKDNENSKRLGGILGILTQGTLTQKAFTKHGKSGAKAFEALMEDWRATKKWLRGLDSSVAKKIEAVMGDSFKQFLKNIEKLKDFKGIGKYTKPLGEVVEWFGNPGKKFVNAYGTKAVGKLAPKLGKQGTKLAGKVVSKAGWVGVVVGVGIDGTFAYNDKSNKETYHNVGKSVVHGAVSQLESAGPIEGAIAGAQIGAWLGPQGAAIGAGVGFIAGGANAAWGALFPDSKEAVFGWVEKQGNKAVDFAENVGKDIGKAVTSGLNEMNSWFGGNKYANA
ncbi:hypothetical protein AALA52_06980 [Lactococcus ileimucosae]|uniref:LXG domain-containing protein n=2 Tax=Lactococcus ileimucosae TaxID=2941329 RepID=A0ABV4D357_9LACT